MHTTPIRFSIAAAAAALLAACGGGGDSDWSPFFPGFGGGNVELLFEARAGAAVASCGTAITGIGTTKVSARVQDLRFHIANVTFVRSDGAEVPLTLTMKPLADEYWSARNSTDSLTLIDLENGSAECSAGTAATNAVISGTVPAGDYVAVKMTLGVPESLNHLDPMAADTPLALTSMALGWNWTTGRIFSKIEITDPAKATAPTWPAPLFASHLGALNCTGNPAAGVPANCAIPNRMLFTLGSSTTMFDPTKQKIVLDLQGLFAGNDVTANTTGTAAGCMSARDDPECGPMFAALQIDPATGLPINGGAAQTVFKAVDR